VFKATGNGPFGLLTTLIATTALQDMLTGPAGTNNQYYVEMSFANNCAPPTQSNTIGTIF
jgi:hypothetical protein